MKYYLRSKGKTIKSFLDAVGKSQSYLNSINEFPVDMLREIISLYPDINLYWLVTGSGPMYSPSSNTPDGNSIDMLVAELHARTSEVGRLHAQIDRLLSIIENMQSGGQQVK